jgi:hypothetical protein
MTNETFEAELVDDLKGDLNLLINVNFPSERFRSEYGT